MSEYDTQTPYISSYVIVRREDKVAFLLRSNTQWMNGYYGLPSGKVEKKENALAAASREALEEIGIKINPKDLKFVHMMHRHAETDWIDVFFEAENYEGEAVNAEPEVHGELAWFDPENLPDNVLEYIRIAVRHIEAGKNYSEYDWDAS